MRVNSVMGIRWLALILIAVAGCFVCGMAWAFSICGSCGYENSDDARFCSHCGGVIVKGNLAGGEEQRANFEEQKAESGESRAKAESQDVILLEDASEGIITVESVKAEMRMAQKYAKQGRVELGEFFARNAFALNMLVGDDKEKDRSNAIIKFLKVCEINAKSGTRRCPDCQGSGNAVMSASTLGDRSHRFETAGMHCRRCGGSGKISGKLTIDERKYRLSTALEEYRTLQQSRGMESEGLVWIPASSVAGMGLRDRVTLKRSLPPVCASCMGLGRKDCSACKGRGIVKCSAKGCKNGYVESESTMNRIGGSLRSEDSEHRVKCTQCRGTGMQSCTKCSGVGSFLCKSCNGSGRAELCDKCNGKGLNRCKRCGGSGIYRDKACSYCQGLGIVECSSCGGTGRRQ